MDDQIFWNSVLEDSAEARGLWYFYEAAISEWVPRIPGLFWTRGSKEMRTINPSLIELQTREWVRYVPLGKSQKVAGGVGTLRLPRGPDGSRLVTLTTTLNVSAGMPALISSDIWERYNLSEGCIVRGLKAIWREMDEHWSKQFPTVRGIPRGYFVLEPSTGINIKSRNSPLNIHPFTVMEYWNGSTQWLDYVYATADTSERGYRNKLEEFFEQYRHADDRQGQYLLASDTYEPMWDALFNSPEEMRRAKSAQLRLIEARIHDALSGEDVIQALAKAVSSLPGVTVTDLRRLSQDAGVDPRRWLEGGSLAGEISRLVNEAVQSGKQHALLQAVLIEGSPTPPDPFD